MSYDLAICRFGVLAAFDSPNKDKPLAALRPHDTLEDLFAEQRHYIRKDPAYGDALAAIEKTADAKFQAVPEAPEPEAEYSIYTMPLTVEFPLDDEDEQSTHLVGALAPELMHVTVEGREWTMRVRASVTACALEVANGLPKIWWTFEGVPSDPDPDNRPSEKETTDFLSFARSLEKPALDHLASAYFGALRTVIKKKAALDHELGDDRIRIRFADNNSAAYEALIDAIRYRGLTASRILQEEPGRLENAKKGVREFEEFVNATNTKVEPGIDPDKAYVNSRIRLAGVDAVAARHECHKSQSVWIAGVAQRPGSRTALDHLDILREQRIAKNEDSRVRFFSAARRLTGHLAAIEAMRLEKKRKHPDQTIAPII
jgi:hypothetical protein